MKKLLLFDIDGTLLKASGGSRRAFEKTFYSRHSATIDWSLIDIQGSSDRLIAMQVWEIVLSQPINPKELHDFHLEYLTNLQQEINESTCISLPGVAKLCEELNKQANIVLGLQTGNLEQSAKIKLKAVKLDHYFPFGGFSEDSNIRSEIVSSAISKAKKHSNYEFDQDQIFCIGDTPKDILAGQANNVKTIACATGIYPKEVLFESKPDFLFEDFINIDLFFESIV